MLQKFYSFDVPKNYQLKNYLDSEHFLHNTYLPLLRKFGIDSIKQIPASNVIMFRGQPVEALLEYFNHLTGNSVKMFKVPVAFKSENVWFLKYSE